MKRVALSAFVDVEQREQLVEIAAAHDRSVSAELRQAIRAHVQREQIDATLAAVKAKPFRPISTNEREGP